MLKNLLMLILAGNIAMTSVPVVKTEVKDIQDNIVITEVNIEKNNNTNLYRFDIKKSDFNSPKTIGEKLKVDTILGYFLPNSFFAEDKDGNIIELYQFKSFDNENWWNLTKDELGFVPDSSKKYTLVYYQNDTIKNNHKCDPKYDCECYLYDDLFLGCYEY